MNIDKIKQIQELKQWIFYWQSHFWKSLLLENLFFFLNKWASF